MGWSCAAVAMAVAALLVATSAAATSHVVGGTTTGWNIPPNTTFYSEWSSTQTFAPGDTLVFNFQSPIHNVVEVPKASYEACSTRGKIGPTISSPPATLTVTPGRHYYICGVNGHCSAGQKLSINVVSSAAAPPSTSRSAPTPAAAPPTTVPVPSATAPASTTTPSIAPGSNNAGSAPSLRSKAATTAAFLLLL